MFLCSGSGVQGRRIKVVIRKKALTVDTYYKGRIEMREWRGGVDGISGDAPEILDALVHFFAVSIRARESSGRRTDKIRLAPSHLRLSALDDASHRVVCILD